MEEERTSLKLIIEKAPTEEKGPREGDTLQYPSRTVVKIGRVVTGNTIAIKDAGISSKHLTIQFDNQIFKWTLRDLHSSNGTILNAQVLDPNLPSVLQNDDRIKIGELTSMIVKLVPESTLPPRRNPRREQKPAAAAAAVAETELGLGFDVDLDKKEPVEKRNVRNRVKKAADSMNQAESSTSRRILRSSKKEEFTDLPVPMEPKKTRGRKKKKKTPEKQLPLDANLNDAEESLQADEGNQATIDPFSKVELEKVMVKSEVDENLETVNGSDEQHVVGVEVEGKDAMADEGGLSQGDCRCWDLETMTLGEYFDYLEEQLVKEINDKADEVIAEVEEKARRYHEYRRQTGN